MSKRIESYFEYYWANDKNYVSSGINESRFMKELPMQIKREIYKDYLFDEFIYMFKDHFKFYKVEFSKRIEIKWMDNNFQQFMLKLL